MLGSTFSRIFVFILVGFSCTLNAQEEGLSQEEFVIDTTPHESFVKPQFAESLPAEIAEPTAIKTDSFSIPERPVTKEEKSQRFAKQFWNYLLENNYKHWSPPSGVTTDYYSSKSSNPSNSRTDNPHGPLQKVYVNRAASTDPKNLVTGAIVVMENYRLDKSLKSVSVMYRSPGFNPSANDWFWVDYNPDGTVATQRENTAAGQTTINADGIQQTYTSNPAPNPPKLVGRANQCIRCHGESNDGDFAFFNDLNNVVRQASWETKPGPDSVAGHR